MRTTRRLYGLLIAAALIALPAPSLAQVYVTVGAPPPLPEYAPPPVSVQNDMWTPGYWAYGPNGYYWVPGTYVQPPETGMYWTPPYWSLASTALGYLFNQGYWAPQVGYYGGINYGAGYYGNGYVGGNWSNGTLMYNTAVAPVNTTVIHNVYINRTVIVKRVNRYSFNGTGGVIAHPTPAQLAVVHLRHIAITPVQRAHILEAARDRNLLARVNGGHPRVVVVAKPLSSTNHLPGFHPVTAADRVHTTTTVGPHRTTTRTTTVHHGPAGGTTVHHTTTTTATHHAATGATVHHTTTKTTTVHHPPAKAATGAKPAAKPAAGAKPAEKHPPR